jgi:hypothetical protein
LDDYYIFDEMTLYFANGKTKVDPKYNPQLIALARKAASIEGYMIQVEGYASSVGSASLNQKLSQDRAANVTTIQLQQGHVSLTRMFAPGAMGESNQVGTIRQLKGKQRIDELWFVYCKTRASRVTSRANRLSKPYRESWLDHAEGFARLCAGEGEMRP